MEARSSFIHNNIDKEQGIDLLFDALKQILYRWKRQDHTISLFGYHPALLNKQAQYAKLVFEHKTYGFWLVRESSIDGFLALDRLKFDAVSDSWLSDSKRLVLTKYGWIIANPDDKPGMIPGFLYIKHGELEPAQADALLIFLEKCHYYPKMMLHPDDIEKAITLKKQS